MTNWIEFFIISLALVFIGYFTIKTKKKESSEMDDSTNHWD